MSTRTNAQQAQQQQAQQQPNVSRASLRRQGRRWTVRTCQMAFTIGLLTLHPSMPSAIAGVNTGAAAQALTDIQTGGLPRVMLTSWRYRSDDEDKRWSDRDGDQGRFRGHRTGRHDLYD